MELDYYETIAKIDKDIADQKDLDIYLDGLQVFDHMEIDSPYLHVKDGEFEHTFKLTNVKSLKMDIRKVIETKINFYQNILDKI